MSQIDIIERYLKSQIAESKAAAAQHRERRAHPFVTISRSAGAGGTTFAARLLEVFDEQDDTDLFGGWQVFDRRLCQLVVKDPAYARSLDRLLAEEYHTKTGDFFRQVIGATVDQGIIMDRVFQVVRALAAIGKAIIIGRGGSEVTKGMPTGLSVRLVAPEPQRIEHLMSLEHLSERDARNEVRRRDAHRARLIKTHFNTDIADPTGYDVTWNTAMASIDDIAEATVILVRQRALRQQQPSSHA